MTCPADGDLTVVICDKCRTSLRRVGIDLVCDTHGVMLAHAFRTDAERADLAEFARTLDGVFLCGPSDVLGRQPKTQPIPAAHPQPDMHPRGLAASMHTCDIEPHRRRGHDRRISETFRFHCSCGALGPWRGTRERAMTDHDNHCEDKA